MKGKFIIDREIFESDIWEKPPYYFKIWIWILGRVNYKTREKGGKTYHRGEFVTDYSQIIGETRWRIGNRFVKLTKDQVFNVLEFLRKTHRIRTAKTTRGLWIKVVGYDDHQRFPVIEGNKESNTASNEGATAGQQGKENERERKKKNDITSEEVNPLISFYKQLVKERREVELEVNWAAGKKRLNHLLTREENPWSPEQIKELFRWFVDSDKADDFGCGLTVALSAATLNLFKEDIGDTKWQYVSK